MAERIFLDMALRFTRSGARWYLRNYRACHTSRQASSERSGFCLFLAIYGSDIRSDDGGVKYYQKQVDEILRVQMEKIK